MGTRRSAWTLMGFENDGDDLKGGVVHVACGNAGPRVRAGVDRSQADRSLQR
jgi:hypothetical protein